RRGRRVDDARLPPSAASRGRGRAVPGLRLRSTVDPATLAHRGPEGLPGSPRQGTKGTALPRALPRVEEGDQEGPRARPRYLVNEEGKEGVGVTRPGDPPTAFASSGPSCGGASASCATSSACGRASSRRVKNVSFPLSPDARRYG